MLEQVGRQSAETPAEIPAQESRLAEGASNAACEQHDSMSNTASGAL